MQYSKNIKSGRTCTAHPRTQVLELDVNERKINSKRKIVAKVLLTWSKMHYHNGNSCFAFGQTVPFLHALCLRRRRHRHHRRSCSCSSLHSSSRFSPFSTSLEMPQPFMSTIQPTIIPFLLASFFFVLSSAFTSARMVLQSAASV